MTPLPVPPQPQMDTAPTSPPASRVAPSSLWRLADRRSRKAASGNIFSNVNLWQLQRLFRAAGDQDAEQRAQLVWGHRDEAELARALIGLRARGHRRGLRSKGRGALESHWLRAFNHLRIGENSPGSQRRDAGEESDGEAAAHSSLEPQRHPSAGMPGRGTGATAPPTDSHVPATTPDQPARATSGLRRGESDPERYLHRILH